MLHLYLMASQTVPGHGGGYVVPASAGYQQTQGGTGPEYVQPEPFLRAGDQDTYVTPVRNGTQAAPEYVYTHDPRGTQFSGHRPPVQETHMGPAVVTPRERAESTESDKSRESEESEESKISQGTQSSGSEVVTDDSGLGPITQGDVKGKKKKSSSALQKAEEDLSTLKKAEEDLSAQPAVEFILRLLKVRDYKRKAVKVAYDMQQKLEFPAGQQIMLPFDESCRQSQIDNTGRDRRVGTTTANCRFWCRAEDF